MSLLKKFILFFLDLPNRVHNHFILTIKNVDYGNKPIINGKLKIHGHGKIILGNNIVINSNTSSNPIGGDTQAVFSVIQGATIKIGHDTGISNSTIFCKQKVEIGNNVKIGGSVKIYDTDFHSLNYQKRRDLSTDIGDILPVTIGNDCFIGAHCIILKGVKIGNRSIVGSGSVVTKSIPEDEIWGGNPAKFIRKLTK